MSEVIPEKIISIFKNELLLIRLESNVFIETNSGCHIWCKSYFKTGYGQTSYRNKPYLVHRLMYMINFGELDSKTVIMHKCDTKGCLNINHLKSGTQKENIEDMFKKGRATAHLFNKNKTHCKNGHEYTKENTKTNKSGRECRLCHNLKNKKYNDIYNLKAKNERKAKIRKTNRA